MKSALRKLISEGPDGTVARLAYQLVVGLGAAGILSLCYFNASAAGVGRSVDLMSAFDASVPFIPWTWWIYFPGYIGGLLLSMVSFKNLDTYYRTLGAVLVAQAFCALIFLMYPSDFPRPVDAGPGLTGDAIRWFWTVDPPNNTFPSTHVAVSVIAALGMWRDGNRMRYVAAVMALGVIITVHTTKQHYLVDTIGGICVALLAFRVFFRSAPAGAPALA
ncbi:MAG: inositol phosphorylceramide synthase [Deltaproteobacteria bacterium]|nr:inositol phosphorylceramide synthase [Deltaproteobacteria bacterium]MCB9786130.1 inositol phosphorylceramide synthase [Deltaproteobacteria bacterium]